MSRIAAGRMVAVFSGCRPGHRTNMEDVLEERIYILINLQTVVKKYVHLQ